MPDISAANLAVSDQILAILADEAPMPVPTSAILDRLGMRGWNATVRSLLNRLAKRGEIEKWDAVAPLLSGSRCCYWRRLGGSDG